MKKISKLFVTACCMLLAIVNNAQEQNLALNTEIAESFISTLNSRDYDQFTALFSANATYEEVCSGRNFTGRAEIGDYMKRTIDGMPDTEFIVSSIVVNEKQAAVEWV